MQNMFNRDGYWTGFRQIKGGVRLYLLAALFGSTTVHAAGASDPTGLTGSANGESHSDGKAELHRAASSREGVEDFRRSGRHDHAAESSPDANRNGSRRHSRRHKECPLGGNCRAHRPEREDCSDRRECPWMKSRQSGWLSAPGANFGGLLQAEIGALAVPFHIVQFSQSGSRIDYTRDGGQSNLFPFFRFEAGIAWSGRHQIEALYQPLDLRTRESPREDLVVDEQRFTAGRPVDFRYGFSFYRLSYFYQFRIHERASLSLGVAGQIRNASIEFSAVDGSSFRANRNIGFVPLLGIRSEYAPLPRLWMATEIVGFYAPIKYLNGGASDVEGAILDASLRIGTRLQHGIEPFLNVRVLGGGASGTERDPKAPSDGFVKNWLYTTTFSLGVRLR